MPRLFIFLLATVVIVRVAIAFVVHSPLHTALGWAALLATLGVAALLGKRIAADAFAWLCLALGADILIQLLRRSVHGLELGVALMWATLVLGVGLYVLRSKQLKQFYEAQALSGPSKPSQSDPSH